MFNSGNISFSQHLGSARGVGVAALTVLPNDIYAVDWNPAGLTSLRDWNVGISNFITSAKSQSNFILHSLGVGKNIFDNHAFAIIYSPGKILDFVVPSSFRIFDSLGNEITAKFDKNISYHQNYSFGYAYRASDNISLGISLRYFESKISDSKYFFDKSNTIRSDIYDHSAQLWSLDIGGIYTMSQQLIIGIVFKNLFEIREKELDEDAKDYRLNLSKQARFGAA
ncbi:MAG: hypothetical protein QME52_14240 [Bacteroidota bacterium]|nr:hypothetical protein [Bacteroidota bacterium]